MGAKAAVNHVDHSGRTPTLAASVAGHCDAVEVLLRATADLDKADRTGMISMCTAARGRRHG